MKIPMVIKLKQDKHGFKKIDRIETLTDLEGYYWVKDGINTRL